MRLGPNEGKTSFGTRQHAAAAAVAQASLQYIHNSACLRPRVLVLNRPGLRTGL
jgi:hypothetical protein